MNIIVNFNNKETIIQGSERKTILDSLIESGLDVPYSCKEGFCGVCICKLQSGEVDIIDDSLLTKKEIKSGLILSCQTKPISDLSIIFN
jgi:ferredoxin